jgi:hypothetical protein
MVQELPLNSQEVYSKIIYIRKINAFGVKIKWPVHPLLKIDVHQRYIFALKIYLHPKEYFLQLSLKRR